MLVTLAAEPGTPGWPNEDFAAVAPGAAVLLDGCTTLPAGAATGCVHGVAWYAAALGASLLTGIAAQPPVPLRTALADAISHVRSPHAGTCDLSHARTPAATVTAVRLESAGISFLALSDSTIAADYGDQRDPVMITDDHQPARADPRAAAGARTGVLPLAALRGVGLFSDGATRVADRFGLLSWPSLLRVTRTEGPASLIARVREAEAGDPAAARWPRRKIHDDATALWWEAPAAA